MADDAGSVYDNYTTSDNFDYNPYDPGSISNYTASGDPVPSGDSSTWSQVGNTIKDAAGKIIGTLTSGQTLRDFIAAYAANRNTAAATDQQNSLQQSAVNNLQALADSLRSYGSPDLLQYVSSVAKAVQLGQVDPAKALATVQQNTQLQGIKVPQQFTDAVNSTLNQLDTVSKNGYTAIERAAIQKALDQALTQSRGDIGELRTEAQERGQYGTGNQLVSSQMAAQAAANTAAQNGLDIESQGLQRALQALQAKGQLGLTAGQQSFDQQKTVASAQDVINAQNAQLQQQANEQNAQRLQQANLTNKANEYHVQDQNLTQSNLQQSNQVSAAQQQYADWQKQQEDAALADEIAARNAASMWGKTYDVQTAAKNAQNSQLNTALNAPTTNGGTDWGKIIGAGASLLGNGGGSSILGGIGSAIGSLFSDEKVKNNKKELSDEDLDALFDQLAPMSFNYKKSVQKLGAPSGPMAGIMAQDMERDPIGATIVIDSPDGKQLDPQKALSLALAALTSQNGRIKNLEGRQ